METYLETHGQSCISVSSWPWIFEEVKGTNKKIERIHCEYYQSKKKSFTLRGNTDTKVYFLYIKHESKIYNKICSNMAPWFIAL